MTNKIDSDNKRKSSFSPIIGSQHFKGLKRGYPKPSHPCANELCDKTIPHYLHRKYCSTSCCNQVRNIAKKNKNLDQ